MSTIDPSIPGAVDRAAAVEVIEERAAETAPPAPSTTVNETTAQAAETAPPTPSTTVNETAKPRLNFKNGLNLVAYVLNITLVYGVGNGGWLGTPVTADLSEKYQTLVTPGSMAFAIWAVIFLSQGAWAILQLLPRFRAHPMVRDGASYWYPCVAATQIGWTFALAYEIIPLSLALVLLTLASLYGILHSQYRAKSDGTLSEFWVLRFPFAVHAGWITAASALNANVQVASMEQPAYVLIAVAIVSLAMLHAVSVWVLFFTPRPNWTIACVLTWAFGWIYSELDIDSYWIYSVLDPTSNRFVGWIYDELNVNSTSDPIADLFLADIILGFKYAALALAIIIPSQIFVRLALLIRPYYNPYIQPTRDNFDLLSTLHRSILEATNALMRAVEGKASIQPAPEQPSVAPPPPAEKGFGEQIDELYKRLKAARETGMEASALRYERLIADLEARDEELTRARFLNAYFS